MAEQPDPKVAAHLRLVAARHRLEKALESYDMVCEHMFLAQIPLAYQQAQEASALVAECLEAYHGHLTARLAQAAGV